MVEDGIMLEDLKELRSILDRFIAKYEKEAIYCVGQLEVDLSLIHI